MFGFLKSRQYRKKAAPIYLSCARQSRARSLYETMAIPDSLDGRFESLCLHIGLVMDRLHAETTQIGDLYAQGLFDETFRQMEFACREQGIGDLSVPKHVKRMMTAFNGRHHAYRAALSHENPLHELKDVIARNLYGTLGDIPKMEVQQEVARYIVDSRKTLENTAFETIIGGDFEFATLPCKGENGAALCKLEAAG